MVASPRVPIDLQLIVVTNRFSHAAHALDELLDDGEVKAALPAFTVVRVDCDARPDLDVALQRRAGLSLPTWPLVAVADASGGVRAVATHLNRRTLLELLRAPPASPLAPAPPPPTATVDEALAVIAAAWDRRDGGFEPP